MRECRLDLEEQLAEKKKSAEALRRECDTLVKKVFGAPSRRYVRTLCYYATFSSHVPVTSFRFFYSFYFLLGSTGKGDKEQPEGSGGRLGGSPQRRTAENE